MLDELWELRWGLFYSIFLPVSYILSMLYLIWYWLSTK